LSPADVAIGVGGGIAIGSDTGLEQLLPLPTG
jgi:hypothetical protein